MLRRDPHRKELCHKFFTHIKTTFCAMTGYTISIVNAQYAMAFPDNNPAQVSYAWLTRLSGAHIAGSIWNGLNTWIISGSFGYHYVNVAATRIKEETLLFYRTRKNARRYVTSTVLSLLAGVAGGSVLSEPYSDLLKYVAMGIGFSLISSISFVGMTDLIIAHSDPDVIFKKNVLSQLKRLGADPQHQDFIKNLLHDRTLTAETVRDFLNNIYQFINQLKNNGHMHFQEKTTLEKVGDIFDITLAGTVASVVSTIHMQSGYAGLNIITNNKLDDLSQAAKIAISFAPGLPQTLFIFLGLMRARQMIINKYHEIDDKMSAFKAVTFLAADLSNSTWYYSLGRTIASNEKNIFSFTLDSGLGAVLPYFGYLTSVLLAINALAPIVIPHKINFDKPAVKDVISALENEVFPTACAGLNQHLFFSSKKLRAIQVDQENAPLPQKKRGCF